MSVKLNHTIVYARDPRASADFYVAVLGLGPVVPYGPFFDVTLGNEVTLAFLDADAEGVAIQKQHYAFLVSESEFDEIFGRLKAQNRDYWADPALRSKGAINRNDGGRGLYFEDPDGHVLEIITRPYGA